MNRTAIAKLSGIILGTAGALLLGGATEAVAANLTPAANHDQIGNEVGSLVTFNVNNLDATQTNESVAFTVADNKSNSGMDKLVGSLYYLMMIHLILSFILSSRSEEA